MKMTALAEKGAQLKAIEVRGIDPQMERAVSSLSQYVTDNAWQDLMPGQQQVILGKGVADKLDAKGWRFHHLDDP